MNLKVMGSYNDVDESIINLEAMTINMDNALFWHKSKVQGVSRVIMVGNYHIMVKDLEEAIEQYIDEEQKAMLERFGIEVNE